MKKLTLLLLVAMVPFLTMAQKRSKKDNKQSSEQIKKSKANYEFMVIKGVEFTREQMKLNSIEKVPAGDVEEMQMKNLLKPHSKFMISFLADSSNVFMLSLTILYLTIFLLSKINKEFLNQSINSGRGS